jgi:hypothetical protein
MTPELSVVQQATQKLFRESLYRTAKYLCGYKEINERTHGKMIQILESEGTQKLIVMPRGTFKTSLACVAYPIWLMIRNPNIRILLDSETWTLSSLSLREIKAHVKSEAFLSVFPNWKITLDNVSQMTISARTIPKKEPTITSSGIGAGKTGQHFDVVIADDLNSPINSLKPELAEQVVSHYRYYTSLLDPGGTKVVIGTRYSEHDLIGFILRNEVNDAVPEPSEHKAMA